MKKYLLILFTTVAFGQVPFSKDNPNTLALKVLGYPNLFTGGYGSIMGVEKGFLKTHSLGTKFIYNHFTPHRESGAED